MILGATPENNIWFVGWEMDGAPHEVEIRLHDGANMLFVSGPGEDVEFVLGLIESADVPPRQVQIEAKIMEVNQTKFQDIGLDWDAVLEQTSFEYRFSNRDDESDQSTREERRRSDSPNYFSESDRTAESDSDSRSLSIRTGSNLQRLVRFLDETGTGTVRNAPRILTVNNRPATILDGERVTYVTRLSAYNNIYETETMDAGLNLSVLPSIGESGYLTLEIHAELSRLTGESVSGSPIKSGQIVDNTVIVRDGEPVLLGGFQRTVDIKGKKRFPILGHILPFLFSRETTVQELRESYIILQARVLDAPEPLGEEIQQMLE
jgi:type II secretory pathway component GspD/PulD (secretin)